MSTRPYQHDEMPRRDPSASDPAGALEPMVELPAAQRLSVVIPVYNEKTTCGEVIRRVQAVPVAKEILVVDDGSTDGTRELLQQLEGQPDLRLFYHEKNLGKGAALRTAFAHVSGGIVVIQDADLEYDPAECLRLVQPIVADQADVVYGSRFTEKRLGFDWHRAVNAVLTRLSNRFTGLSLTDMETGHKVFRREVVQRIGPKLTQDGFGIEPEMTSMIAREGYRVLELPIGYARRGYAEGKKIGIGDALTTIWCIVRFGRR